MLLLILLAVLPADSVVRESVDHIEVNSMYDDQGRLVFDQLLFFDWHEHAGRFNLRAWRMVKPSPSFFAPKYDMLPQKNHATGLYDCHWQDGDVPRLVVAKSVSYSRTSYDPEISEREFLAKELRRELRSPKTAMRRGR